MTDEKYMNSKQVLYFIEKCNNAGKAVIGFEAFKKEGKKFIPQIDYIADFSSILQTEKSWEKITNICNATSKNILSEKIIEKDLFYELVVLDKNAWEKRLLNRE